MAIQLIGRKAEQEILRDALASHEAELVSVIGRRRIGKTFLVNSTYGDSIVFEITGIQDAPLEKQLRNFTAQLTKVIGSDLQMFHRADQQLVKFFQGSLTAVCITGGAAAGAPITLPPEFFIHFQGADQVFYFLVQAQPGLGPTDDDRRISRAVAGDDQVVVRLGYTTRVKGGIFSRLGCAISRSLGRV